MLRGVLLARGLGAVLVFCIFLGATSALAAPTAEQLKEINAVRAELAKAGTLYTQNKFKDAGQTLADAQARVEKLSAGAGDALLDAALADLHKRLTRAHALLELEGVKLPELKSLEEMTAAAKPANPGQPGAAPAAGGGVSFTKEVAPILISRCGGCHVRGSRGMFSMLSYEALMKGPPAGLVIFKGDGKGSVLMEKIEAAEMPPNGQKIPDAEIALLTKWINEGAKYDGADPKVDIQTIAVGVRPAASMTPMVTQATGKETISFSKDIAPVLAQSCTGCHGANRPRENFSVLTFENLLKGGDRGAPIAPGKPDMSLLLKKLKGTADGQRMPMGMAPLSDDIIAKFEKWIAEGATFDGPSAKQSVIEVAALAKAKGQTHEQLSADRARLAEDNWRLGMADIQATKAESTNFLVLGNVGEATLNELAAEAEKLAPKVGLVFKAPADQPLLKGRMTLFVFRERYDYGEFGRMVEKRELPPTWRGHFRFSIVDAYAAIVPPKLGSSQDYSTTGLITEQLSAGYVASLGKNVPAWFATGVGRAVASRLYSEDSRIRQWDDALSAVLAEMPSADAVVTGKMNADQTDIAAYSYCKFLMADAKRFQALIDGLRKGGDFTTVFSEVYRGSPGQVAELWARNPPKASAGKAKGKK